MSEKLLEWLLVYFEVLIWLMAIILVALISSLPFILLYDTLKYFGVF